ncbi:2',3'-cyclic-nucleotide 2'-phosphodiesterase / 3'-nucleotidase [Pedococcus dokdonensis]|uniref:2',3'-cyclic-nucleotide 2'-phosphodiesterase / 3'-nucleotidase n=1 Tax=Pedococcus dokdonensis TaxID=443156 RepID=A0A1H0QSU5_9MICO|nr:5'-nucleotidase C-terminal domain-containing protein [Pedococcus dokdonensis]SDP20362.1 2',3'-cyclic-nucleotide 2'-phosphodiesterase / 3'-nucleotidase [Pedococcus dokdonensis]
MTSPRTAVQTLVQHEQSRREMLALAVVGGAGAAFFASAPRADAVPEGSGLGSKKARSFRLTVLGTTDTHGNVLNWDYFKDLEYDDTPHNDIGLAKIATLVKAMRAERGAANTMLLDAGDTIQGTPLAYYYAKVDPITGGSKHPMAKAMNAIGYDAAALGNHEFNYGLDTLRTFESQCDFPLLSANSVDWTSGAPIFKPHVIRTFKTRGSKPVKVGILGLVTPGVAIWDKANVEGQVKFPGIVEQAKVMVPRLKKAGCDLVIVSCHSGARPGSSYGDALPFPENASRQLAEEVAGIDAVLVGHAHEEITQLLVPSKVTPGKDVLLTEPLKWGMRLSVMDFDLEFRQGRWTLAGSSSHVLNANTVPEDPEVADLVGEDHAVVRTYVNSVIGTCTVAMSAATARFEDTAAMDFINHVQADAVKAALAGTPDESLPVLSIAAPFNRDAAIPAGNVTVRDVAGLYIYDNTLLGIRFTGAQVKAYLEYSAAYFKTVSGTGPFAPDAVTGAISPTTGSPIPDYNYDIMGGLDASLAYDIDIAQPVGQRIVNLTYAGQPVDPAAGFVIAINNYRQSGGGGFPGVTTAPVLYNAQVEIRQLLIDWTTEQGVIDPTTFTTYDWKLVSNGQPVVVEGAAEGGRH